MRTHHPIIQLRKCSSHNFCSTSHFNASQMIPKHAQVVVCGAGALGNSVAYHLVKMGWKDIVVLDQDHIGCGVTRRGTGLVGHFHSAAESRLTGYSASLYRELQEQGHDTGWNPCGALNVARTKERMIALRRRAAELKSNGLNCEVIGPKDLIKMHPLLKTDDLEGGVWVPPDGVVNPLSVCKTLANIAQKEGAKYFENCRVTQILVEGDHVHGVDTTSGRILCEYVALCAGIWSRELGKTCSLKFKMPIHGSDIPYLVTRPIPGLPGNTPILRDYDGPIYSLPFGDGLLVGGFRQQSEPVSSGAIQAELSDFQSRWNYLQPLYEDAKRRLPILANVGVENTLNGPNTFTPDGHWILGETPEIDRLFVAVGSNGNPVQAAGGLGKALAEWIVAGEPKTYLLPFDIRRFIGVHNNQKFLQLRVNESAGRQYVISHPLQIEFYTARNLRRSPLYAVQESAGAVFGERMGFERPLYFEPEKTKEEHLCPPPPTFGKPRWFDCVKEEYYACRERVGIIDMSSFTKLKFFSPGTEVVDFLQKLCSNDIDVPIRTIVQTGMQNKRGGYENDCMLLREAENSYFMVSPTAQQTRISEWIEKNLPETGSISVNDVTSMYTVLNVVGPKSKELLKHLTQTEMQLAPLTCKQMNVGYASNVLVMGYNNTGEPGYSLYIPSEFALHVYSRLMSVGRDYGVQAAGYYTLRFLRIEKFIPFWGEELDSNTTPLEIGRGSKVKMEKPHFLGKEVLEEQLKIGVTRQLVHFQLENHNPSTDFWPWGREPIFRNGQYVGLTTSAGFGFTLGRAVCLGFVHNYEEKSNKPLAIANDFVTKDAKFEVEIVGKRFPAKASIHPPTLPVVEGVQIHYVPKTRAEAVAKYMRI